MAGQIDDVRAYQEKLGALLQESKSRLAVFEAQAKGKKADVEIAAINMLKVKHAEIDRKVQDLKAAGEAKATQVKAGLDAEVASFKSSMDQLSAKFKGGPTSN